LSIPSVVPCVQAQVPFTMVVQPDRIILGTMSGFTDRFTVTVMAGQSFNDTVNIAVAGVPENVAAVFRNRGAYLAPLTVFATYLEVTSSPSAKLGNYALTVSAASQGPSVFHAVAVHVTLMVQEIGQPRVILEDNRTQVTVPSAPGREYVLSLTIVALVAGAAIGSVATYILMREKVTVRQNERPSPKE